MCDSFGHETKGSQDLSSRTARAYLRTVTQLCLKHGLMVDSAFVIKVLVLIPARYASTRFPGKSLAQIAGKSMIERISSNCSSANRLSRATNLDFAVAVVTDSKEIEAHTKNFGGEVIRVDEEVCCGTDRIYLAWQQRANKDDYRLVINVQGDIPLFAGEDLLQLAEFHLASNFDIATAVVRQHGLKGHGDPNKVKVVGNLADGACFYFSRAAIPHPPKESVDFSWWLHVGVYSYRPSALESFFKHPKGIYEEMERLEQLRAIEAGLTIGACEIKKELISVDVPRDIKMVEKILNTKTDEQ